MIIGKSANAYNYGYDINIASKVNFINSVKLQNAEFQQFMVLKYKNGDEIVVPSTPYPEDWNLKLILHADYRSGSLTSGNSGIDAMNTTDILVKRREKNGFKWQTIFHKKIEKSKDFKFSVFDYYARNDVTYEYAIVPVNNGIEGTYIIKECDSSFDGYYIVGRDKIFNLICDVKLDRTANAPRAFVAGLNKTVPTTVKTSSAKYVSGNINATLLELDCSVNGLNEKDAWRYRNDFLDWIYDGTAKFIKSFDNRTSYIIEIESGASESDGGYWNAPSTSFSFVQIGSVEKESDLVNSGLLDLEQEWWSI